MSKILRYVNENVRNIIIGTSALYNVHTEPLQEVTKNENANGQTEMSATPLRERDDNRLSNEEKKRHNEEKEENLMHLGLQVKEEEENRQRQQEEDELKNGWNQQTEQVDPIRSDSMVDVPAEDIGQAPSMDNDFSESQETSASQPTDESETASQSESDPSGPAADEINESDSKSKIKNYADQEKSNSEEPSNEQSTDQNESVDNSSAESNEQEPEQQQQ